MNKEKLEYLAFATVAVLGVLFGGYIFIRYALFAVLPFLIAWTVAFSVRPMAVRLSKVTKLPVRVVSAVIGTVSVLCILTLAVGVIIYAASEAWDFVKSFGEGVGSFDEILNLILNPLDIFFGENGGGEELRAEIASAISSALADAARSLVSFLTGLVSSVPRVIIFIIISSISTVYFCLDLEAVNSAVKSVLPVRVSGWLVDFKNRFLLTMLKYLRSYLFLMLLTFVVMIFAFMIMKIPFAVFLAFLVALLDALPLIGVGTVLVPWAIFELIFGSGARGVGLLITFGVSWLLRQFAEPRIVGKNLGIHPIISLVLLYLGYSLFGVTGLFIVPLGAVILEIVFKDKVK